MQASAPTAVAIPAASAAAHAPGFYIPSLDGLRAVSFLIVFVAHAGMEHVVPGGFGVTVFFFLSGYLITTLMRMEMAKTGRVSFKQFYLRRALRILPPFYIVLVVATALTAVGVLQGPLHPLAVLSQALHYANYWIVANGYSGQALGTGVYWSLAVEEHFYFAFPALYVLLHKLKLNGRQQAAVFFGLCGLVLAWRFHLVLGGAPPDRTYVATDTRVDSILFGCALAVHHNPMLDEAARGPSSLWRWVLLPLGIAGLLFSFLYRAPEFRETWRYTLQGLSLFPLFMVAIREPGFAPFRLLNTSWLAYMGTLSYSLYLVHHVVVFAVHQHLSALHPFVQGALALGISMALSWGLYQFVEKPCAQLRRRLSRSSAPAATAGASK